MENKSAGREVGKCGDEAVPGPRPSLFSGEELADWAGRCFASGEEGLVALREALAAGLDSMGEARVLHPSGTRVSTVMVAMAAREGLLGFLEALLSAGAHPDGPEAASGRRYPPLVLAGLNGQREAVAMLLAAGADVNLRTGMCLPIEYAMRMGHQDVARDLARAGACLDDVDGEGNGAAEYARMQGFEELASWLAQAESARVEKSEFKAAIPEPGEESTRGRRQAL